MGSAPRTTLPVPDWIETAYPHLDSCIVTFPRKHVVLVTINRPQFRNCLPTEATIELGNFWIWYDNEPGLRSAVFTGAGDKAFCSGMDLKARLDTVLSNNVPLQYPRGGFAGMSNRTGRKPIFVACNGHAHGGLVHIDSLQSAWS
jgi:enoyl-CoA hydratase/carnithine racemase